MHLGLVLLLSSLARSCWCAPQQTCHPGDAFLGKIQDPFPLQVLDRFILHRLDPRVLCEA